MKTKTVSNLALNIGKMLDVLEQEETDVEQIAKNRYFWNSIFDEIKRQVKKKGSLMTHEIDFGSADMISIQNAATTHLNYLQQNIGYDVFMGEVLALGSPLTADKYIGLLNNVSVRCYAAGVLRDVISLSAYWAMVLKLLENDDKAHEIGNMLFNTLKAEVNSYF